MSNQDSAPKKKLLPRDLPGSFDLIGGTGGIVASCSCGDFLEAYKEDATFRVKSPEAIDPERTNPNAPFVVQLSDNVGSRSLAVARVLVQSRQILDAAPFRHDLDKTAVIRTMHGCKEALVACEKVTARITGRVTSIVKDIESRGVRQSGGGRALSPFPHVSELEDDAALFLINARRAIQAIAGLPATFLSLDHKDTNFDALGKTLTAVASKDYDDILDFITLCAPGTRHLVELRNFQEHPGTRRTVVENVSLRPDGSIAMPVLYVSGDDPLPVMEEFQDATAFLIGTAETMLLHLVMLSIDKRFPLIVVLAEPNPRLPIKYRLSLDISKVKFPPEASQE